MSLSSVRTRQAIKQALNVSAAPDLELGRSAQLVAIESQNRPTVHEALPVGQPSSRINGGREFSMLSFSLP